MPLDVRFEGFPTDAVITVNGNTISEAQSGGGTITSFTTAAGRTSGFAPFPVLAEATMASTSSRFDIPFNDMEVAWSCSEAGNFTAINNNPIWGLSKATAYSPVASFTFEGSGSHTISATGYDSESSLAATDITVTVTDQDTQFAGADTAVLSLSTPADYTGAPSGSSQFTTLTAAMSHLSGRQNQRLLIQAGESLSDQIQFQETTGSNRNLCIGSYGAANNGRATLDFTSDLTTNPVELRRNTWDQVVVENLEILGPFDSTFQGDIPTEPGNSGIAFGEGGNVKPVSAYKVVNNCIIDGFNIGISFDGFREGDTPTNNRDLFVNNTTITNWVSHGLFGTYIEDICVTGCSIEAPSGAVNADEGRPTGHFTDSSCMRSTDPAGVILFANNHLSVFSHNFSDDDNRIISPITRIHAGGDSINTISGTKIVFDRNRTEGGPFDVFTTRTDGVGPTDNFIIVDRLHHIETSGFTQATTLYHGGSTMRNAVVIAANVAPGASTGHNDFLNFTRTQDDSTRRKEAYSNFFLDDRSAANARNRAGTVTNIDYDLSDETYPTDSNGGFVGNNVEMTRNRSSSAPDSGNIDETAQWTSGWTGEVWALDDGSGFETPADRQYQGSRPEIIPIPQTGHSAIGDATGKVSILDWSGNERGATIDRGPFKVS